MQHKNVATIRYTKRQPDISARMDHMIAVDQKRIRAVGTAILATIIVFFGLAWFSTAYAASIHPTRNSELLNEYDGSQTNTLYERIKYIEKERNNRAIQKRNTSQVIEFYQQMKSLEAQQSEEVSEYNDPEFIEYYYDEVYYDFGTYSASYGESNPETFRLEGVQTDGTYNYAWYSENVLPGEGLDIPGRHVGDGGYVMDEDNNICVASNDLEYGTVVETPYGQAKVYDSGCDSGIIDLYTNW